MAPAGLEKQQDGALVENLLSSRTSPRCWQSTQTDGPSTRCIRRRASARGPIRMAAGRSRAHRRSSQPPTHLLAPRIWRYGILPPRRSASVTVLSMDRPQRQAPRVGLPRRELDSGRRTVCPLRAVLQPVGPAVVEEARRPQRLSGHLRDAQLHHAPEDGVALGWRRAIHRKAAQRDGAHGGDPAARHGARRVT